jgi:GntR family transcriptional regulator / MocR family aminotransferase
MITERIPPQKKPKFIFVTPSHQFPLGGTLPIQRRIELIEIARKFDCYIVEDDYDSEFRYQSSPIHSPQGLAPEQVIYIRIFSKILFPGLRLGCLILPLSLIEYAKELKWFADFHTPSLEQMILARFIAEGHLERLERHIREMKKVYQNRGDCLQKYLAKEFGDKVRITGDSTGLHLIAEFEDTRFSEKQLEKILEHQIKVYPVEHHAIQKGKHHNKIILGYGNLTEEKIREGVQRLKAALLQ